MKFVPAQGIIDDKKTTGFRRLEQTGGPPDSRALLFQRRRHRQSSSIRPDSPVAPFRSDADDKAAPARQPAESLSGAAVTASGKGFAVGSFRLGEKVLHQPGLPADRSPERFLAGYEMLIHDAGLGEQMLTCKVTARGRNAASTSPYAATATGRRAERLETRTRR